MIIKQNMEVIPVRKLYILLVLLFSLCMPFMQAAADAEGDYLYTVTDGTATITAYTGSESELTLPVTLGGCPVTAIGYCAFRGCAALTQVEIGEGVASIGSNAFQNCSSLIRVSLPDSLTTLGTHAFYGCPALTQITLPEHLERLHPYAFYGCSAVRLCSLGGKTALTLSDYGYTFTSPDYPQLALYAFEDSTGARTLTISDCDESAVSASIPDGVTVIDGYAFCGCSALTALVLPDSVAEIAYSAFEGCSALREITLPAAGAVIAGDAFSGCTDVTVIAPEGSAAQAIAQALTGDGFTWRPL